MPTCVHAGGTAAYARIAYAASAWRVRGRARARARRPAYLPRADPDVTACVDMASECCCPFAGSWPTIYVIEDHTTSLAAAAHLLPPKDGKLADGSFQCDRPACGRADASSALLLCACCKRARICYPCALSLLPRLSDAVAETFEAEGTLFCGACLEEAFKGSPA